MIADVSFIMMACAYIVDNCPAAPIVLTVTYVVGLAFTAYHGNPSE